MNHDSDILSLKHECEFLRPTPRYLVMRHFIFMDRTGFRMRVGEIETRDIEGTFDGTMNIFFYNEIS